jgi:hypothetical protein
MNERRDFTHGELGTLCVLCYDDFSETDYCRICHTVMTTSMAFQGTVLRDTAFKVIGG